MPLSHLDQQFQSEGARITLEGQLQPSHRALHGKCSFLLYRNLSVTCSLPPPSRHCAKYKKLLMLSVECAAAPSSVLRLQPDLATRPHFRVFRCDEIRAMGKTCPDRLLSPQRPYRVKTSCVGIDIQLLRFLDMTHVSFFFLNVNFIPTIVASHIFASNGPISVCTCLPS